MGKMERWRGTAEGETADKETVKYQNIKKKKFEEN